MDIRKMSTDEIKAELRRREEADSRPVKEGFLKTDLFHHGGVFRTLDCPGLSDPWFLTPGEVNTVVKAYKRSFEKILSAGARFLCYIEDGKESWWDEIGEEIEGASAEWAVVHLENIREV